MVRNRLRVLLLSGSLLSLAHTAAQDALELSETYTAPNDRVSFDYPADWVLQERDVSESEYMNIRLSNTPAVLDQFMDVFGAGLEPGQVYMEVSVGDLNQVEMGLEGITAESSVVDILEAVSQTTDLGIEFGEIIEFEIGGRPTARIEGRPEDGGEGFVALVDYGDGIIGGVVVQTATGELAEWDATAMAIAESIEVEGTGDGAAEVTEAALPDLTESVTVANDMLVVHYPAGWLTEASGDEGVYIAPDEESLDHSFGDGFASGEVEILVSFDTADNMIADMNLPLESAAGAQKILQGVVKAVIAEGEGRITFEPVETVIVGDQSAAMTRFTSLEFEGTAWAIDYPPNYILAVQLLAAPGEAAQWEALALAITEAVEYPG